MAGRLPGVRGRGEGGAIRRRRRPRVRRLLPRRHGGDDGACTGADAEGGDRPVGQGDHAHAPERGRALGGGRADSPIRRLRLAIRADRDRCQPLRHPARTSPDGAVGHPRLQLVLPRHRRRDVRDARRGRRRAGAERQPRPAGRSGHDDARRRVQRPECPRARARDRRRRGRPRGAGSHEHRNRPSRTGLPRRTPRAHSTTRRAPGNRRDAHDLLRPGRLHAGAWARTGRRDDRQADRGRHPGRGVRVLGGGRRRACRGRSSSRTSTSAASAGRWLPTRSRSRPCERRSAWCSPTTRSIG